MINPALDRLPDYPFQRLRDLLDPIEPAIQPSIMMSLGEPQHPYPALLTETLQANNHLYGKYPPIAGTPDWRQAVKEWLDRRYGIDAGMVDPAQHLAPVAGTREGLFMCAFVAVPRPDIASSPRRPYVLMPNPFYQCYAGAAIMSGAEPVYLPARREHNFFPDFDAIETDVWANTAMVYFCSPANPQGTMAPLETLKTLLERAREFNFVVVADECYSEIYTGDPPPGMIEAAAALGGSLTNLLIFNSLSKRSNAAGLRSGFVVGDAELVRLFLRLREYGGNPAPLPTYAAAAALWREETHVTQNRQRYQAKFKDAADILGNRFGYFTPPGGFFLWLEVDDGAAAAEKLWRQGGVRVLPGEYLSRPQEDGTNPGQGYIRLAMVHDENITRDALRRVADIL